MQVDFLMSGLMVLKERIDATEALIAIDLDNRRNELVAFDLVSPQAEHEIFFCRDDHLPFQEDMPLLSCLHVTHSSATEGKCLSYMHQQSGLPTGYRMPRRLCLCHATQPPTMIK